MDVTSVNLTAEHLRRASLLFDEAAQGIARILGKRVRLPGDFRLKQRGFGELGIASSDMGLLPTMGASDSSELNEKGFAGVGLSASLARAIIGCREPMQADTVRRARLIRARAAEVVGPVWARRASAV